MKHKSVAQVKEQLIWVLTIGGILIALLLAYEKSRPIGALSVFGLLIYSLSIWRRASSGPAPFVTPKDESATLQRYADKKHKFRYMRSEIDVQRVVDFDSNMTQTSSFRVHKTQNMMEKIPDTVLIVDDPNTGGIGALFSLWPLKEKSYKKIISGAMEEDEIETSDLADDKSGKYWWVGLFGVSETFKKIDPTAHYKILVEYFDDWIEDRTLNDEVEIVAGVWASKKYKNQVENMLKMLEFKKVIDRPEQPIWVFSGGVGELERHISKYRKRSN